MNQDLIDLLRDELPDNEAAVLRARIEREPALADEYRELQALFGLVHRAEMVEPTREMRRCVMEALEIHARPSWWQEMFGLVRFRFRNSIGFRISVAAHVVALAILTLFLFHKPETENEYGTKLVVHAPEDLDVPIVNPDPALMARLAQRSLPKRKRIEAYGAAGQETAIKEGLAALMARQARDGSFGSLEETGYAALVLLAEGHCSAQGGDRGRRIQKALDHLTHRWESAGETDGSVLAALVEDYVLSYPLMSRDDLMERVRVIEGMIPVLARGGTGAEGLMLAKLASFAVPEDADFGDARYLAGGNRRDLLKQEPTRLLATAALSRGPDSLEREQVRAWVLPLFLAAMKRDSGAERLLTLQAPYRF